MPIRVVLPMTLSRLVLLLLASLASQRDASAPSLTYLANEGVLLEGRGGCIFLDAFFGDGLPDYPVVPAALRDSMERGLEGFAGPAAALTTHPHRDHFDPAALARYLGSNAEALAVGPAGIAGRLDSVSPGLRTRTRELVPTGTKPATLEIGWARVQALAIPHGHTVRPVAHVAYLIGLDGTTALHLGDTDSDPDTWPELGLPSSGVDLALVPFWYALDDKRFASVLRVTRARTVVLLHLPRTPDRSWVATARELRRRYPQVAIPTQFGSTVN
jgi:L-ascorbate metabolism protein UlaG (beta-lactamase superfamily)